MKEIWKRTTILLTMTILLFTVKLDAKAEIVRNLTGEKDPWGYDYDYKYWGCNQWCYVTDKGYTNYPIDVSYKVTYNYEEAYKMLEYVNEARREAGVPELILKDDLMDVAMQRAAECCIFTGHIRPDGSTPETLSFFIQGENIHYGQSDAKKACNSLINSKGHYETMIDPQYKYVGFGYVNEGSWVQIFCTENLYYEDGYDAEFHYANDKYVGSELVYCPLSSKDKPVEWDKMTTGERKDYSETFTAKINPALYWLKLSLVGTDESYVGNTIEPVVRIWHEYRNLEMYMEIDSSQYDICCSKQLIKTSNGLLKCGDVGEVTVKVSLKNYPQLSASKSFTIETKKNVVTKVTAQSVDQYKITNKKKKTVTFLKTTDNDDSVTIPKTITIDGEKYKVTAIAESAFKGNKVIKSITIGANVSKIGKNAFNGCKNLKKITVKSAKLKSVGKNALKGIHKKAVIKVPKSKLSKYKKLFKGKGQKKSVKIKK